MMGTATVSAPCTPTGLRQSVNMNNRAVPFPHQRVLSFGSDSISCSGIDRPEGVVRSVSISSSATNSSTRSVNLYDLIDEEFVVNCGAFGGSRSGNVDGSESPPRPQHRRRKSILDMIDRICTSPEDEKETEVMTTRSYPRGVYVVTPTERENTSLGNVVALVSSEAYNQW